MQKHFRLLATVFIVTASSFGAVAQTETYKDVILDGKKAKLNITTGEITLVNAEKVTIAKDENPIAPEKVIAKDTISNDLKVVDEKSSAINAYEKSSTDVHVVQKGETLYSLSKLYHISLNELKQANNLETTSIKIGQNLRIRNYKTPELNNISVWTVSKGDTLYNIANRNNTTVQDIKSLNGLENNLIVIGQKLRLK